MNETPPLAALADFLFGQQESDEAILRGERARWSGIRHRYEIDPLDPLPGQIVTLTVSVGGDVLIDRLSAYITTDGSTPMGKRGVAERGFAIELARIDTRWQQPQWTYADIWQGSIPGQPEGAHVRYRIEGWHSTDASISHWGSELNLDRTPARPTLYGYSVDRFAPPAWAHEAIIYHIFVDRFAPAPPRWLDEGEMEQFIGGNLRGVIERLDYIVDLGATAIWLTPIFRTNSYHAYDTLDYFAIDERFGSEDDLRTLIEQAHSRGLRVILDFVANHTSHLFAPFQQALNNPDSPHRAWYSFDPLYQHGYRAFFAVRTMPQLNLDHDDARAYLIAAARHWLDKGVDGLRLDYAIGPSHDFWAAFGAACKRAHPDCWLFGEVTTGSDLLRTYAGRLDGCLDFGFTRQIRRLCLASTPADAPISHFAALLERTQRYFPASYTRPNFLDNHDMNRFLWLLDGDKQRLRLAAALLFWLGSTPILYYGTEVGLSQPRAKGPHREESRHPMLWSDRQDAELLAYFRSIIAARRRHPALIYGGFETRHIDDARGLWLVERRYGEDRALVAVNAGDERADLELPSGVFTDLAGRVVQGRIALDGRSAHLLVG